MTLQLTPRFRTCLQCIRRLAYTDSSYLSNPLRIQVRGKKRLPKSETIPVRLLTDVAGYGSKGTIIAVAPARMRNIWYPNKNARYMTQAEIKDAKQQEVVRERDHFFGVDAEKKGLKKRTILAPTVADMSAALLSQEKTLEILDALLPAHLDFYRRRVSSYFTEKNRSTSNETPSTSPNTLFGSVQTMDIMANIKALLAMKASEAGNEDAAKVVVNTEDIRILQKDAAGSITAGDKVKMLGEFEIEIFPHDANPIRRHIRVIEEQS